jgi:hypothetical protein
MISAPKDNPGLDSCFDNLNRIGWSTFCEELQIEDDGKGVRTVSLSQMRTACHLFRVPADEIIKRLGIPITLTTQELGIPA